MDERPLDELIERLNGGDLTAAEQAYLDYVPYLRMAIGRQLTGRLRAKLDSMDLVQSVWVDVLVGFRRGHWHFADRTQLRAFLVRAAKNRLIDRCRQHRRALERERPLADARPESLPGTTDPRPSEIVRGQELWEEMVRVCPPAHRELLRLKRQGLTLAEIAERTGLHEGSVRRILYTLARRLAAEQGASPAADAS
jgi:RNA polymerase sigma-70 factor (ECF subfamily)